MRSQRTGWVDIGNTNPNIEMAPKKLLLNELLWMSSGHHVCRRDPGGLSRLDLVHSASASDNPT